ncbi:DUF2147 domain-containing protein [Flammeovirga pectinis]|uniref:DUF2147 domain-containing protein n=1 Tax=Flammeovirga pectinis TaxID=2494373 RepID=A0A3S9NXV8_9BACT|nr:DUF2147 domain-containing protein [Flammeovirga pectinis]AZQ60789.1 DUF2147 domain-containing protein [Flammeovirga pectinis]
MKNLILIMLTLCSLSAMGQSKLNGIWNTGDENTKIEISESNGELVGNIKSSDNTKAKVGTPMLKDFVKEGTNWKAKIYAAKKQKWYDATVTPKGDVLKIEISVGFLSKTLEWKRVP